MFKFVCISGILGDVSFVDRNSREVINIPFDAISRNRFAVYDNARYTREELEKLLEK